MNGYFKLPNGLWVSEADGTGPYTFGSTGFIICGTQGAAIQGPPSGFFKLDTGFWTRGSDGSGPYVQVSPGQFKLQSTGAGGGGGGGAVDSVNGQTGVVTLVKADVGLGNVDNTSDATKFTAPTFTGIVTAGGANVTTAAAVAALAIDVTKTLNTKSVVADSTFTFSGTPGASDQWFGMYVKNSDTAPHILTFPSSFSQVIQAARTTCPIAASGELWLTWRYDGAAYKVFGDTQAVTGTGSAVFATSPTLVTPVLGVAAATSINKVALTAPATGATLTIPDGAVVTTPGGTVTLPQAGQTFGIGFGIDTVANQDYTIALRTPFAGTITETSSKCTSGTATATFKVNSTALGGTANAVSSTQVNTAQSSSNTFAANDAIVVTMSANSTCLGAVFALKYTRALA